MPPNTGRLLQSEVLSLIRDLRNERGVETNWPRFRELIESNLDVIVATFSVRWLVSICDTYVDYGEPAVARHAMTISYFANMLRLAETVKFTRPEINRAQWEEARGLPIPLYEGLTTFSIDKQDVFLNLARRFTRLLKDDHVMTAIWRAILGKLKECDTVIEEFARGSLVCHRYFPAHPNGITDNYGR